MRSFLKYVLATIVGIAVIFSIFFFVFFIFTSSISKSAKNDAEVKAHSLLVLNVGDEIYQQTQPEVFTMSGGIKPEVIGLQRLKDALNFASTDSKIDALLIKLGTCSLDWATLQDVRQSIVEFQKKKPVYAWGNVCDQKSLFLASAAKQAYLNPVGAIEFKGLSSTTVFIKNALDKLGIEPEVFYAGKFKGATEFVRYTSLSEPNRLQISDLLNDFYSEFLQAVSEKSGHDTATLRQYARNLSIQTPANAVQAKLFDGLRYEYELFDEIKKKAGISTTDKLQQISIKNYSTSVTTPTSNAKDIVAVLFADGQIIDQGSGDVNQEIAENKIVKEIKKIAQNDNIKALVLRVNSPGGSALASENIYQELMQLKKKKPIIISMANYAASGGYYISCAGDYILAEPTTITGSIGVFSMLFNTKKLLNDKLGVTTDVVETEPSADFPSITQGMSPLEKQYMQNGVDTIYATFLNRVAAARKLSVAYVDSIAQGHVYSGKRALAINLVDKLGNLNDAVKTAADKIKSNNYKVQYYPAITDDVFSSILDAIKGKTDDDEAVILKKALGAEYYNWYNQINNLRKINQQPQAQAYFLPIIK